MEGVCVMEVDAIICEFNLMWEFGGDGKLKLFVHRKLTRIG